MGEAILGNLPLFARLRQKFWLKPIFSLLGVTLLENGDIVDPRDQRGDHLIIQGRHPVVEQTLRTKKRRPRWSTHAFVPNDCSLNTSDEQIALYRS